MLHTFKHNKRFIIISSIITIIILGALGYGIHKFVKTFQTLKNTESELALRIQFIEKLQSENNTLNSDLQNTKNAKDTLNTQLSQQVNQNSQLTETNQQVSQAADMYKKLATYDKQLLAKYSKVYFLNENYFPTKLTDIPTQYASRTNLNLQFLDPALPFLNNLMESAHKDGVDILITSAYRSFTEQKSLKSQYDVSYGINSADTFSADQGYSEHQLGTAVDFTTSKIITADIAFEKTPANTWLQSNAYKYGFILSYPKDNTYYIYEPWHWRFVGIELATYLHDNKKNFYDMDQRFLDTYLIKIFDSQ